jgi:hypothetical protein
MGQFQLIFPGVPTHLDFAAYDHLDFAVLLRLS